MKYNVHHDPPQPDGGSILAECREIAPGVKVLALAADKRFLSVVAMVSGAAPDRAVCAVFRWEDLEALSGPSRVELAKDWWLLSDPACQEFLARGLRTAYGLAVWDALPGNREAA